MVRPHCNSSAIPSACCVLFLDCQIRSLDLSLAARRCQISRANNRRTVWAHPVRTPLDADGTTQGGSPPILTCVRAPHFGHCLKGIHSIQCGVAQRGACPTAAIRVAQQSHCYRHHWRLHDRTGMDAGLCGHACCAASPFLPRPNSIILTTGQRWVKIGNFSTHPRSPVSRIRLPARFILIIIFAGTRSASSVHWCVTLLDLTAGEAGLGASHPINP